MRILITAGNTLTMIDRVRAITNVFTGRTGARIARHARSRGHAVTLLTSHPDTVADAPPTELPEVVQYRTFDDLEVEMSRLIVHGAFDVVVHCAAVSDYRPVGTYAPAVGTRFDPATGQWDGSAPAMESRAAGKVKSDEPELWLRLARTPKLVDRVRSLWGFRGLLVKFKLEVGVSEERLLEIAEQSRVASRADLMVANTLEGAAEWAYLGPVEGRYERVDRADLESRLIERLEAGG